MIRKIAHWVRVTNNQDRRVRFVLSRIMQETGLCRLFKIRRNGYDLWFYPTSLCALLWVDNRRRTEDEQFLELALERGDTFVDVGANIGTLSLKASRIVIDGHVFSFEPHPKTFAHLQGNIALNRASNITAFNAGLAGKGGSLRFTNARSDDQNRVSEDGVLEVEMRTLDSYNIGDVKVLKIDVEGFEKLVLEGASSTLERTAIVYYESWETHFQRYGYRSGDVIEMLNLLGFTVYRNADRKLAEVGPSYSSTRCENLVAIKDPARFFQGRDTLVQKAALANT